MSTRRFAAPAFLAAAAMIILAVLATILWFQPGEGVGAEPTASTCEGADAAGAAPSRSDIAFGPDVRDEITGFDQMSSDEKVEAVVMHQASAWCQYSAIALANAMHRGVRAWPSSAEDWTAQLKILIEDRDEHLQLVAELLKWEVDNVVKVEIVYNYETYLSDWFDRSGEVPVLIRGDGHAVDAGWVIRRTLKDGTTLDERLVCMYQMAGPVPPLTPPGTTTPPPPPGTTTPPPVTTAPCGDKSSGRLPDGSCGVPYTTVPRSDTTAPTPETTRPTVPPTAPPDTLPSGVTPTTWDTVPTPSTIQLPDSPPVTGVPPSTVTPPVTAPPATNTGTVPRP